MKLSFSSAQEMFENAGGGRLPVRSSTNSVRQNTTRAPNRPENNDSKYRGRTWPGALAVRAFPFSRVLPSLG